MPKVKKFRSVGSQDAPDGGEGGDREPDGQDGPGGDAGDFLPALRVTCPVCEQPVGVTQPAAELPGHAVCPTPWNPFGSTVCPGSGSPVPQAPAGAPKLEAVPADGAAHALPDGLDWRLQPFSHAGGPGAVPVRLPAMRRPAARPASRAA